MSAFGGKADMALADRDPTRWLPCVDSGNVAGESVRRSPPPAAELQNEPLSLPRAPGDSGNFDLKLDPSLNHCCADCAQ